MSGLPDCCLSTRSKTQSRESRIQPEIQLTSLVFSDSLTEDNLVSHNVKATSKGVKSIPRLSATALFVIRPR